MYLGSFGVGRRMLRKQPALYPSRTRRVIKISFVQPVKIASRVRIPQDKALRGVQERSIFRQWFPGMI